MRKETIELHKGPPANFKYDKSFIVKLEQIKEQYLDAVKESDPSVESQVIDGYKQGKYDAVREIIAAFKRYG